MECRVCKYFNGLGNTAFHSMGMCALNGETTGENSSCNRFRPDIAKIEKLGKRATDIYYSENVTAKEALEKAKEG